MITFTEQERMAYREASADEREKFPDGEYRSVMVEAGAMLVGSNKSKMLLVKHKIVDGDAKGNYTHFLPLDNPNAMGLLKKQLRSYGLMENGIELDDIDKAIQNCVGNEYIFNLKTNGKYQNCYIKELCLDRNKLIPDNLDYSDVGKPKENDDDIPWDK